MPHTHYLLWKNTPEETLIFTCYDYGKIIIGKLLINK